MWIVESKGCVDMNGYIEIIRSVHVKCHTTLMIHGNRKVVSKMSLALKVMRVISSCIQISFHATIFKATGSHCIATRFVPIRGLG